MKKINLSKPMLNLDGSIMFPENKDSVGIVLAGYLMKISTTGSESLFVIAEKLADNKEIELSEEELSTLITIVDNGNMENIVSARILQGLNDAK